MGSAEPERPRRILGSAYGRAFAVEVPGLLGDEALGRLPFGWTEHVGAPERYWEVRATDDGWTAANDEQVLARVPDQDTALDRMIGDLELWVAEHAEGFVFVHAGAVAWHGRAIVVPGRTLAGKSTLVAALVRAGATYYSDEYTVLDPQGLIRPYARMLSIRPPNGSPPRRVTAEDIGGHTGTQPVQMALVAHLRYDAAAGWAVEELSRGRAAMALLDNTVPARTRPVEVMDHLQAATDGVCGLTGTRGEAHDAAGRLLSLLGAADAAPGH
ncbi:MAG TPA: hypothetical protein VIM19_04510 [Actinomycetes bacterium]